MYKKYNYIKNKTTYGVFFSGLFLVATTLSSYAANTSNSESETATVKPTINVVKSNDLGSMSLTFTESDITKAQTISTAAGDIDGEYYMLIASYQVCILSNALSGDANDSAGILMKVAKSNTSTFWKAGATGANPTTSGINQLALYNSGAEKKIPFLIQVTPAGYTKSANVFGSAGTPVSSGQTYAGQYTAVPFIIGGDADNMATTNVFLHDADASSSGSAVAHENLALDVYGAVNHYGLNADLEIGDVSSGTATTMGLDANENHTLGSCSGDQNPTDTVGSTSMLMTIKLYANAAEMALAPAGDYSAEYTLHYGDIDDQDGSAVYDTAAQGSDLS